MSSERSVCSLDKSHYVIYKVFRPALMDDFFMLDAMGNVSPNRYVLIEFLARSLRGQFCP